MSLDPADFALTDDQLHAEWQRVRRALFVGVSRNPRPLVVFVGAQPGAGKTRSIERVQAWNPDRDFVALDSDELRKAHPRFDDIMAADPEQMPVLTNQAASAWFRMGLADARAGGYDVLIENSFHSPDPLLATAAAFADAGYRIEVVALAVPEADSRLGMVDRYLQARQEGQPARWTNNASHDAGYTGVPATVTALELSPLVDRVLVTDRAGDVRYDSTPGTANTDPSAADAVRRIRDIPKTPEQAAVWTAAHRAVVARIDELGIADQPAIVPVMDRLERTARDVRRSTSRPRPERPDRDTRRRSTRSVDRPAQSGPAYDGSDYDGPDYDDGPSHRHGHGPSR